MTTNYTLKAIDQYADATHYFAIESDKYFTLKEIVALYNKIREQWITNDANVYLIEYLQEQFKMREINFYELMNEYDTEVYF